MKTIYFNTGRQYTAAGQRIIATLHDDGQVTFHDIDRCITGEYTEVIPEFFGRQNVMAAYDQGTWSGSKRAWEDGMLRGGCNAEWVA